MRSEFRQGYTGLIFRRHSCKDTELQKAILFPHNEQTKRNSMCFTSFDILLALHLQGVMIAKRECWNLKLSGTKLAIQDNCSCEKIKGEN